MYLPTYSDGEGDGSMSSRSSDGSGGSRSRNSVNSAGSNDKVDSDGFQLYNPADFDTSKGESSKRGGRK